MNNRPLEPEKIRFSDCVAAIRSGWDQYRLTLLPSIVYASVAAVIGFMLMLGVGRLGISPMLLPFAGGFMLVAPAMLSGFFRLATDDSTALDAIRLSTPFIAFLRTPLQIWVVAFFCAFMFIIWITDAGVLYSFIIGGEEIHYVSPWLIRPETDILMFWFWGALMGSVLALIIFSISAFSIPILYQGRGMLVEAVSASVRAVFRNFSTCMSWAIILSLTIILSTVLLPLLLITLPVTAFASFYIYQKVFPLTK